MHVKSMKRCSLRVRRWARLSTLVAAGLLVGGLSAGSASAADLGGNCCANARQSVGAGDAINSFVAGTARFFTSEVEMFGLGIAQDIKSADMKLPSIATTRPMIAGARRSRSGL